MIYAIAEVDETYLVFEPLGLHSRTTLETVGTKRPDRSEIHTCGKVAR